MTKKGVYTTGILRNHSSWIGLYDLSNWLILNAKEEQMYCCKIRVMLGEYKIHEVCLTLGADIGVVKLDNKEKVVDFKGKMETKKWIVANAIAHFLNEAYA